MNLTRFSGAIYNPDVITQLASHLHGHPKWNGRLIISAQQHPRRVTSYL